ncbi:hypothetical protein LEP1GSC188_2085 [Leptospira weilii serovar Topaz str. LT2116]|uniref:Leucine rich repeat protein n=1 Tax=Leptospira weilii serovar Topaz str. LT2116 TaxID=1088540 RepID=M3H1M4_9LEPT|nr:hypothetical protein LEP1GSC188_2085 [Leptospira weilii serovar Topaz str. LT2116]
MSKRIDALIFTRAAACIPIFLCLFTELRAEEGFYWNLAEALQNPSKVRALGLAHQALMSLPKEIGQLQNLQELNLIGNQIERKKNLHKALPKCKIIFEENHE